MHRNVAEVEIERPARDVFPYLIEPEKRVHWVHGLVESTTLDDGELGVGTRFRDVVVDHGQRTTIEAEVERYDPYDGLTARLEARGFVSRVDYDLAERDGRTRVACTVETDVTTRIARLLAPLVTRQAQRAIATSLTTLKQLLEA
jgi:uncharacterized protein YndB with AHSA1/START domain